MKRRGQVTLWVIIGIVLVASVALFVFIDNREVTLKENLDNPQRFMADCLNPGLEEVEKELFEKNGYLDGEESHIVYLGEEIPYLCKASTFYEPCINQEPLFVEHLEKEIKDELEDEVNGCFNLMQRSLIDSGKSVRFGEKKTEVFLQEEKINLDIEVDISISDEESGLEFKGISVAKQSVMLPIAKLAQTIVNFESEFCEFDHVSWMQSNKEIRIDKFRASEGTKIYTLTDRKTEDEIKFAVKSCVLPAGL